MDAHHGILLSKALKTKFQIAQNKYIRFCLELPPRGHINPSHFRKINWLPVERRLDTESRVDLLNNEREWHHPT